MRNLILKITSENQLKYKGFYVILNNKQLIINKYLKFQHSKQTIMPRAKPQYFDSRLYLNAFVLVEQFKIYHNNHHPPPPSILIIMNVFSASITNRTLTAKRMCLKGGLYCCCVFLCFHNMKQKFVSMIKGEEIKNIDDTDMKDPSNR